MLLVIGSRGFIGSSILRQSMSMGVDITAIEPSEFDYGNPAKLKNLLLYHNAPCLINTAGYTGKPNVDTKIAQLRESIGSRKFGFAP
tara:strand:- start:322 stop:582 length:261 start_codon:yes stop_codon:yes gene_type:complete